MDFSSRGFQRNNTTRPTASTVPASDTKIASDKGGKAKMPFNQLQNRSGLQILTIILLGSALILAIAMLFGLSISPKKEMSYVNKDRYQVVALADGQAYFGKINAISDRYIELLDVYYLNDNNGTAAQSTNAQLIKRGCEPHQPEDRMVIYRDQINFWENIQEKGQIAMLIKQYQDENKDKPRECDNTQQTATPQQETESDAENNEESTSTDNQNTDTRDRSRTNQGTTPTPDTTTPETTPPATETPATPQQP